MIGSSIIKIRDFTFIYGVFFIIYEIFDIGNSGVLEANAFYGYHFTWMIPAGFCSALLLLFDPGSSIIEKIFSRKKVTDDIKSYKIKENEFTNYLKKSLNINSIIFQKDQLVYMFYFIISGPLLIAYILTSTGIFEGMYSSIGHICLSVFSLLLMYFVWKKIKSKWGKFCNYLEYSAWYKVAVDSKFVFKESCESLRKSIEQGDWEIARDWCEQVKHEYECEANLIESRRKIYEEHVNNLIKKFIAHIEYNGTPPKANSGWCTRLLNRIESFGQSQQVFSHFCTLPKDSNLLGVYIRLKEIAEARKKHAQFKEQEYHDKLICFAESLKFIFDSVDIKPLPIQGGCMYCLTSEMLNAKQREDANNKLNELHLSTVFGNVL